jgi:hypothetical protein
MVETRGQRRALLEGNVQKGAATNPWCYPKTYTRRLPLTKVASIAKDHCSIKLGVQDASPGMSSTQS